MGPGGNQRRINATVSGRGARAETVAGSTERRSRNRGSVPIPRATNSINKMLPEPTEECDRPYPQEFIPRQEWQRRQQNQEILISKPAKSGGFEHALQDADLLTIQQSLEDLAQLPRAKSKIKLLEKRQKQLETETEQVTLSGSTDETVLEEVEEIRNPSVKNPIRAALEAVLSGKRSRGEATKGIESIPLVELHDLLCCPKDFFKSLLLDAEKEAGIEFVFYKGKSKKIRERLPQDSQGKFIEAILVPEQVGTAFQVEEVVRPMALIEWRDEIDKRYGFLSRQLLSAIAPKDSTDETVLEQSEITTIIRIGDRVSLQIPADAEVAEHDGREGWVMQELSGSQDMDILIDGFQNEHYTLTCDRTWLSLIEVSPLHIGDVVTVVRGFPKHHTSDIQSLNPKERKLWLGSGLGKWIPFDAVKRFDTLKEASEAKPHLPEATTQAGVIETEALEPSLGVVVHVKNSNYDVYIGRANSRHGLRGSKWQNPYRIGREGDRPTVLQRYKDLLMGDRDLMAELEELRGKRIACWCCGVGEELTADDPIVCHGQVLLKALRGDYSEPSLPMVLEGLEIAKEFRFEPLRQDADVLQGCLF